MARAMKSGNSVSNGSALGFEATLWATADKLRGNLDAVGAVAKITGKEDLRFTGTARVF